MIDRKSTSQQAGMFGLVFVSGLLGLTLATAHANEVTLYAVSGEVASGTVTAVESLYTINMATGAPSFVLQLGNGSPADALAESIAYFPESDLLYRWSGKMASQVLQTINPDTLSVTNLTQAGSAHGHVLGATYHPPSNRFLMSSVDESGDFSFHSTTLAGVAAFIGGIDDNAKALAWSGNKLYAIASNANTLLEIDPGNGTETSGPTVTLSGTTVIGATGLARNPLTGELWALLRVNSDSNHRLVTLDPATGVATLKGNIGGRLAGLAFRYDAVGAWRSMHFSAADLNDPSKEQSLWGNLADPDGDGLKNLEEFTYYTNPLAGNALPVDWEVDDESVILTFPKNRQAFLSRIRFEVSTTLKQDSWRRTSIIGDVTEIVNDDVENVRARLFYGEESERYFAKVVIDQ